MRIWGTFPCFFDSSKKGKHAWVVRNVPRPFIECIKSYFFIDVDNVPKKMIRASFQLNLRWTCKWDCWCIIDQYINSTEFFNCRRNSSNNLLFFSDIDDQWKRFSSSLLNLISCSKDCTRQFSMRFGGLWLDFEEGFILTYNS